MAKFCANCGTQVSDDTKFCANCGANVNGGAMPQQQVPTMQASQVGQVQAGGQAKSKIVAGLLAIFLGTVGAHNFYLGYTGKAVAQLLISILTCGIGTIVTGPWALIEGIMILCGNINVDANGNPLTD